MVSYTAHRPPNVGKLKSVPLVVLFHECHWRVVGESDGEESVWLRQNHGSNWCDAKKKGRRGFGRVALISIVREVSRLASQLRRGRFRFYPNRRLVN